VSKDYLSVLYQVACGFSDIHNSGKIHRDIKRSNIKFDSEGVIKILDFGLATDAKPNLETIDARGTPCYIAPELYKTPPVKYTAAVEVVAGLDATLEIDPKSRPRIADVRDVLGRRSLYGQHRAVVTYGATGHQLSTRSRGGIYRCDKRSAPHLAIQTLPRPGLRYDTAELCQRPSEPQGAFHPDPSTAASVTESA